MILFIEVLIMLPIIYAHFFILYAMVKIDELDEQPLESYKPPSYYRNKEKLASERLNFKDDGSVVLKRMDKVKYKLN